MIRIMKYGEVPDEQIFARTVSEADVASVVSGILADVKENGDTAVLKYTEKFDRVALTSLQVTQEEIDEAVSQQEPAFLQVLREAADNIRKFHSRQIRSGFIINDTPGVVMGQKIIPIDKVGLYVPGGLAAYPSSVLMDVIPAKLAGCPEVFMITPPNRQGKVDPVILAAASVAGVDRIFKAGGAQAIAALAYGTETVPAVDKIFGPGNAYVAEAKRQVYGMVSIDMIAGPSEILIVADGKTDPALAAADLLSQAEHDRMAGAVMVTDSPELAENVRNEIERQISLLDREEIARASIDANGKIIIAGGIREAIEISNRIAPEHLELCVDDPFDWLDLVRNAGSVFLGRNCPEAVGDYFAGPNHTLPTLGTARFSSPLSVDDFVKKSQYTYLSGEALADMAEKVALFARKEGLTGHAASVLSRKNRQQ